MVLLLSSIFFYSWGAPRFIFVILGTTFIDFYLVQWMDSSKKEIHRKLLLALSVSINVGLLFYFKYSNFFVENINVALSGIGVKPLAWTKLILPIGISFYTFETITYVVDVYRRIHKPLKIFWDYQLYIILFPKLIAGPIIRYHDLADQITDRTQNETADNRLTGFYRFSIGLAKKVLIANAMGVYADAVFTTDYSVLNSASAWMGALAYTFQIYFDFSGYSDMAIGLAKMMGFIFPENFNNPYISQNITEFWRRWHISLGNWMRNYLYIPLGGNKVSNLRLYFNLWLVFLASGLWHGASWAFVFWGAYHGFFLVIERVFLIKLLSKAGRIIRVASTFLIVIIGWVFFRENTLADGFNFIKRMFGFYHGGLNAEREFYFFLVLATIFAFFAFTKKGEWLQNKIYFDGYSNRRHLVVFCIATILLLVSAASITTTGFNPFIYFRF
ncbi:MAG: MBOAT family protein [Bacteroidetes bacterium]|nr:MBOAT family protein [Bacteroidota bacterium]